MGDSNETKGLCMRVFLVSVLIVVTFSSGVYGIGVASDTSYLPIDEGERRCVTYGVFNSGDEGINVGASVHNGLADLAVDIPESTFIPGNTLPGAGDVPLDICFTAPDDLFDNDCSDQTRTFAGFVLVVEQADPDQQSSGSSTTLGSSSGLTVDVVCSPVEGGAFGNLYLLLVVIIIVAIIVLLFMRRRHTAVEVGGNAGITAVSRK